VLRGSFVLTLVKVMMHKKRIFLMNLLALKLSREAGSWVLDLTANKKVPIPAKRLDNPVRLVWEGKGRKAV
jgi:hypothetical protein